MKLRYFIVDTQNQLRRTRQAEILGLWEGQLSSEELGHPRAEELRMITVLCDDKLQPRRIYLLRLPLTEGRFTQENYLTLQVFSMRECVTARELAEHHLQGWPTNLFPQLAVAADVPIDALRVPMRVGGPLFLAAALGVTPKQALQYLR